MEPEWMGVNGSVFTITGWVGPVAISPNISQNFFNIQAHLRRLASLSDHLSGLDLVVLESAQLLC